jgi:Family of unknown function (DUF6101)
MEAGGTAAGSSRAVRLDPFSLPVRFEAADEAADERRRVVDLFRERVVVRRCVGGMRMALNLPVSAFRGVAIRLKQTEHAPPSAIDIVLEHGDPALSLPLFSSETADEIAAEWQAGAACWGCPCWSPSAMAACASRSRVSAPCWWKRLRGGAVAAARLHAAALRCGCDGTREGARNPYGA